jgi:hypothetical protein
VSLKNRPDIYEEYRAPRRRARLRSNWRRWSPARTRTATSTLALSDGPDGDKARYIKDVINAYRRDARAQIMDKYAPVLEAMAADQARRRATARAEADQ